MAASELVKKCCFKLFRILQIKNIIFKNHIKKCIANALNISPVSSVVIFLLRLNMVHLHRVSTEACYLSGFFHIPFVDGLQG